MTVVKTDVRVPISHARRIPFAPAGGMVSRDVENAILEANANAAVAASTPPTIAATSVNFAASPYTVQASDYVLEVDTSGGAVTINMPSVALRGGKPLEVKDVTGNASANAISVVRNGTDTIDGQTTYPMAADFISLNFRPNKAGTGWEVTSW